MVCINRDALRSREYAFFKEVDWSLSKTDIATILEVFDVFSQSYSSKDIDGLYGDGVGHFVFLLTSEGVGKFDLYHFLSQHYSEGAIIDCISAKQLFPKNISNGVYNVSARTEADDDSTSSIEDEATGYIDEEELKSVIGASCYLEYAKTNSKLHITECRLSIGRSSKDADFVIRGNTNISRCHCYIYSENNKVFIEDNNSLNGTFINSVKIGKGEKAELSVGDIVYVADEKFVLK